MTVTVKDVKLPVEMDAGLIETLASAFNADRAGRPVVDYLGLVLGYVSWSATQSFTLVDLSAEMQKIENVSKEEVLASLAESSLYLSKPLSADRGTGERAAVAFQAANRAERLQSIGRLDLIQSIARQTVESLLRVDESLSLLIADRIRKGLETAGYFCNGETKAPAPPKSEAGSLAIIPSRNNATPRVMTFQQLMEQMTVTSATSEKKPAQNTGMQTPPEGPFIQVFDPKEAYDAVQKLPTSMLGQDGNARLRTLLTSMAEEPGWRVLTEVPAVNPLDELEERFPHFSDVIDFIRASLALAGCGKNGKPVRIAPILLRGEPGTGKTYFAQELARVLGSHFVERDLSVTSEAFVISGMDSVWKNSKPGVVFDALIGGKTANPVICLNEVDKAHVTGSHNSPLAPMYGLLEPTSSAAFSDEFVPVKLNASGVIWILTANDGHIPEPILTRLEVFDIKAPTKEDCRKIAASVWTSVCDKVMPAGHGFETQLSEELLEHMSTLSPRFMRKALTNAAARAALDGRTAMTEEDLKLSWKRYAGPQRNPIGFSAPSSR